MKNMKQAVAAHAFAPAAVAVAAACFVAATLGIGTWLDGHPPLVQPLALPGALGMANATAFNTLAFLLPGALLAWVAIGFYWRLPPTAGLPARLGAWMWVFATIAFAGQGMFALDVRNLDAPTVRLHGLAWTLWWLDAGAGSGMLAMGLRRLREPRHRNTTAALLLAALVPVFAVLAPTSWGTAVPQRIAYALWFCGWWNAARAMRAASQP